MEKLQILSYDERHAPMLSAVSEKLTKRVLTHADILPETVTLAMLSGKPAGLGFLTKGITLLAADRSTVCHVDLEFQAKPGHPREVEISDALLTALIGKFRGLKKEYPGRRLVLRTWAKTSSKAYTEYLAEFGFKTERTMLVMERNLSDISGFGAEELPAGLRFTEVSFTEPLIKSYLEATGEAFGVPESEAELRHRLTYEQARVYAMMRGECFVSAVSVWPLRDGTYETESIFCIPEEQHKGITGHLMRRVLRLLRGEGVTDVTLNVYSDNENAIRFYQGLGYEITGSLEEMWLET